MEDSELVRRRKSARLYLCSGLGVSGVHLSSSSSSSSQCVYSKLLITPSGPHQPATAPADEPRLSPRRDWPRRRGRRQLIGGGSWAHEGPPRSSSSVPRGPAAAASFVGDTGKFISPEPSASATQHTKESSKALGTRSPALG